MVSPKFVRVTVQTPTTEIIAITCLFILFFKHVALTRQRKGKKYSDYDSGGHEMHLFFLHLSLIWCWFTKSQIGVLRCIVCIMWMHWCTVAYTILWTVRVTRRFMYLSNVSIIGNNIYGQLKQDHRICYSEKSMSALDVVRMQQRWRQRRSWLQKK